MSAASADRGAWVERTLPEGVTLRCRRYSCSVPVSDLVVQPAVRDACSACPQYGRQFSCPPHSPVLTDYVGDATHARVVCLRLPLDHLDAPDPALRQRLGVYQGQRLLADEILAARVQGHGIAGCGACPSCPTCSAAEGEAACRLPEQRIYSLESLGVNVVELLRHCFAIDLEWGGPDAEVSAVHAVGAVFHRG